MSQHHTNPAGEASNTYTVQINPAASVVELVGEGHYWTPAETWDLADAITFARACENSLADEDWEPSEEEGWTRHALDVANRPAGGPIAIAERILHDQRVVEDQADLQSDARPPANTPTAVEATFDSPAGHNLPETPADRRSLRLPEEVTKIQYRAHVNPLGVAVSVTLFANNRNRSYYLTPETVSPDLNAEPPPAWVPAAPTWFNDILNQMRRARR